MGQIAIPIPQIPGEQEITVEVKINGVAVQFNYRIELFYWEDCKISSKNRVDCIREIIENYDKNWDIYQIGMPNEAFVPITFRRKHVA